MQHGGLQAAEAEVVAAAKPRPRQSRRRSGSIARRAFDGRAAGETESEEAADLVECLAGGVISRAPEPAVDAVPVHEHEVRVAAGDDQPECRQFRLAVVAAGNLDPIRV